MSSDPRFQAARDEWDNRLGRLSTAARNWRLTALVMTVTNLFLAGAVIYFGAHSKYVPFLIQVDKIGQTLPLGAATELGEPSLPVYRYHLARLIQDTRSVYTDANAQTQAALEAYAYLTGDAQARVTSYLADANPFKIAKEFSIAVQVNSVLRQGSAGLWQIQWTETKRPIAGAGAVVTEWRAVVTTTHTTPKDLDRIQKNPTGIVVSTLDWSRILTQ